MVVIWMLVAMVVVLGVVVGLWLWIELVNCDWFFIHLLRSS